MVQRNHAVALVKELGAESVWEAANGVGGLAILAREVKVDLILLDLEMPRMDGIAFIGELAARGFRPRILITSSLEAEVLRTVQLMAETYGLGLPGAIAKPLKTASLVQALAMGVQESPIHRTPQSGANRNNPDRAEILRGIDANEFICFFQPQVTFQGAFVRGVEALVRWRHPRLGLLGPAAFLPQVEKEEALMSSLTMRVLESVAESWHSWNRRGLQLEVSVNLSALSLGLLGFADCLLDACDRLMLLPRFIVFEVTESASVGNLGHCLANLARLRMRGFKLSIDDFGTGFATFEQLERLPITELKIDQSITKCLPEAERQMLVARRMVQMAQDLKLVVVAEGIETIGNWQAIRLLGCQIGQGYFIARPMPAEQIPEWVQLDRSHLLQ